MHVVLGHVTCFGMECGEVKMYQFQAKPFQAPYVLGNAMRRLCAQIAAHQHLGARPNSLFAVILTNLQTCSPKLSRPADMQTREGDITYCCMSL